MLKTQEPHTTIVVSAVNLIEGGTLTILRECLAYLSILATKENYRVVALVFKRELADYPNIEYVEIPWPKKLWVNRLWFEYVSAKRMSKKLGPVSLWLSLHDTTPNVVAERRAVYCHNPFPFYKWKWREWFFTPKIVLLAIFSKFIYKKNITKNTHVVVQQEWIREAFLQMFYLHSKQIIVASPDRPSEDNILDLSAGEENYNFVYAASPNSHKNFECLTEATEILQDLGVLGFKVSITVKGEENAYAHWLYKKWGHLSSLNFAGFMTRETLFGFYAKSHCLVFPSKVETWGLPITEFGAFDKPMLLADLPYAYETAAGCNHVAFFDPNNPQELAKLMMSLIRGDSKGLEKVQEKVKTPHAVSSWEEMFKTLLFS
ncbi:glycosyltransferase [Pedobacter antarcticus 4BY]|uniref:Glycosyltransferase n=2 Tax=Pedobacter antarcticus TaxID=34086 RepID=A0A081PBW3_9SPHI|nr:glycosyltransferase family 1 protein [Pedobacter antarcticus]KEQ28186.1 glycosyltransferase [Pedobacter antarcticus 4BY]SFE44719.1 Glycosyltransferase involved in cell wall bisynthesis [Pedobacter antarcticus]